MGIFKWCEDEAHNQQLYASLVFNKIPTHRYVSYYNIISGWERSHRYLLQLRYLECQYLHYNLYKIKFNI